MGYVRIRNKDRVYLGYDSLQALNKGRGELLIPANVEEEGEVVHLEEVAVRRLVTAPGQGVQADDGGHPRRRQSRHFISGRNITNSLFAYKLCRKRKIIK